MVEIPNEMRSVLLSSAEEMFQSTPILSSYSQQDVPGQPLTANSNMFASVLGFSGEKIKGSLSISTTRELLDKSHPNHPMGIPVVDSDLGDWSREIVNQILGRFKNKLAKIGVVFTMSTPTTVTGSVLQISPPKDGFAYKVMFKGDYSALEINFFAFVDKDIDFSLLQQANAISEGDAILF